MKRTLQIIIIFTLFIACTNNDDTEFYWIPNEVIFDVESENIPQEDYPEWIDSLPTNIKNLKSYFVEFDLEEYSTDVYLDIFSDMGTTINTSHLTKLDSTISSQLFVQQDYKNEFSQSYLYSIEKPRLNFYFITVFRKLTEEEKALMLLLFNSEGKYLNALEVADFDGETSYYLTSKFVNDSTITQKAEHRLTYEEYKIELKNNEPYTRTKSDLKFK